MSITIQITGVPEALQALDVDVAAKLQEVIDKFGPVMTRFGASITPVDTGAMQGAWKWGSNRMYISPNAYNPRSGAPVSLYAGHVDRRVGILDAVIVQAPRMAAQAAEEVKWFPR